MRNVLLWGLLIAFAVVLLIVIGRSNPEKIGGLAADDFMTAAYYLVWLVAIGASVIVIFRRQAGQAVKAALFWIAIGLAAVIGYTYRSEIGGVTDRVMSELMPGRPSSRAMRIVEIVRGRSGEFQVAAHVNGARVSMVLDTGATAVVLTQEAAKAAGLPLEMLVYNVTVDTANGRTRAAAVTLDTVGVGDVIERAVPALIAQPGQLRTSLLGMSFLNRLESWEMRGDKVLMRGYP